MIRVGTSGYSYDDWQGTFYPSGTKKTDFLAFYSQHFDTCEINYTYYRMPDARTLARMVERSGGGVTFAIKLTRTMTHERLAGGALLREIQTYRQALQPFAEAGVLGAVLAQFPQSFRPEPASWEHLQRLVDGLRPLPMVAEFRHAGWVSQSTFETLRDWSCSFCCVDEPDLKGLLPRLGVVTAPPGYVRFHGRNRDKWYHHDHAWERYDHLYADAELAEWIPRLRQMTTRADDVFVFFNNHFQAKAVSGARRLMELIQELEAETSKK